MKIILFSALAFACSVTAISQSGLEGIIVEKYYISDAADSIDAAENFASYPLHVGSVTYRVYADLLPGYKVIQMFGNANHTLNIETTTAFYNDPNYGFGTYAGLSVANTKKRTALIDSYLTVGGVANGLMGVLKTEDTDGTIDNIHGLLLNNDPLAGSPIVGPGGIDGLMPGSPVVPNTLGLSTELSIFEQTAGSVFTTNGGTIAALGGVEGITASNTVLLGQFTTDGVFSFCLNLQLATPEAGESQIFVPNNATGEEIEEPSLCYSSNFVPTPPGLEGLIVEKYYVADFDDVANADANNAAYPLSNGTVTYRVFADLLPGFKVTDVFGDSNRPLEIESATSFYNDPLNGVAVYDGTISPTELQTNTALIDSYLTLGGTAVGLVAVQKVEDSDGTVGNLQNILANDDATAGDPITGANGADGLLPGTGVIPTLSGFTSELSVFDQTPGSGFSSTSGVISAANGAEGITESNQVLIGQFTTDGVFSFNLNLRLSTPVEGEVQTFVYSAPIDDEMEESTLSYVSTDPIIIPPGLDGIVVESYYASDLADSLNANLNGAAAALSTHSITYRVFADLKPGFKVNKVFGSAGHPLEVSTTGTFYNDPQNSSSVFDGLTVSEAQSNTSLIDSYLTIGASVDGKMGVLKENDNDGSIGNTQGILANDDEFVDVPITGTDSSDGLLPGTTVIPTLNGFTNELNVFAQTPGSDFTTTTGEIAVTGGVEGVDASANHVLIGQFTSYGVLSFKLNLELQTPFVGETQTYVAESPEQGQLTDATLTYESPLPPPHITGVDELTIAQSANYLVYPNPCADQLTIVQTGGSVSKTRIDIYDATGKLVLSTTNGTSQRTIDTTSLSEGIYSVLLSQENMVESVQFIKR